MINNNELVSINGIQFEFEGQMTIVRGDKNIAVNFNKFFIESIEQIIVSIDTIEWMNFNYNLYIEITKFELLNMSQLVDLINSLQNRLDANNVLNSTILKATIGPVGHVILNLFNTFLAHDTFPSLLKISTIHPIPKVNNTIKACEFRPINTLPPCEKFIFF